MLTIRNRHQVHAAKFTTVVAAHKTVSRTFAFNFVASTSIVPCRGYSRQKVLKDSTCISVGREHNCGWTVRKIRIGSHLLLTAHRYNIRVLFQRVQCGFILHQLAVDGNRFWRCDWWRISIATPKAVNVAICACLVDLNWVCFKFFLSALVYT